jgi:hypothetical protein
MKWNLTKTVIVTALLAFLPQLVVCGQGQSQPRQASPRSTLTTASYNFLIASGFLCDPASSDDCPAVAQAGDGETMEITGAGTLNLAKKSVTAAGTFTQKTSAGAMMITGVWTATGLVSFQFYGIAPFALLRDYPQLRTLGMFPMGGPMMFMRAGPMASWMAGPLAAGGLAVINIRLLPDAGSPQAALLRVNCAKGKVPEYAQADGIRLAITGGPSFNQQVNGRTVFLLQRPMPNFAWKRAAAQNQ